MKKQVAGEKKTVLNISCLKMQNNPINCLFVYAHMYKDNYGNDKCWIVISSETKEWKFSKRWAPKKFQL